MLLLINRSTEGQINSPQIYMKDWPFFLAILALLILLLPIHEGYESKPATIETGYYYIKCGNKFCSVEGRVVVCKKDVPDIKDLFYIEKTTMWNMSGYNISPIQKYNNQNFHDSSNLICSDEGGRIICNKGEGGGSEFFRITDIGSGYYVINGPRERTVCANENGAFLCNSKNPDRNDPNIKIQLVTIRELEKNTVSQLSNNSFKDDVNKIVGGTNNLASNVTGLENTHNDLKGSPIQIQQIINSANAKKAVLETGISKIQEAIPVLESRMGEVDGVDRDIKSKITTLNDETFPGSRKDIFDLHTQYDKGLDVNKYHRENDETVSSTIV